MAKHRESDQRTNLYVYGIVPADVQVAEGVKGVGDPPGSVTVIREGDIAALVGPVSPRGKLGTPDDLKAYSELLDATAAEVPVLPIKFGAVLQDEASVRDELLAAHHDEFRAALDQLEGKAEYIIRGRYDEKAVLREVLDENEQAQQLRERIRGVPEDASRQDRMALGELIGNAIAAKRDEDTGKVVDALNEITDQLTVREPTHDNDAVHVACLAETGRQSDIEAAVSQLADEWQGRVELRLLGPLAAYDFVVTTRASA
jgi:hypothetical protein